MNELIAIKYDENSNPTILGRDLHEFLEVETRYNDWFKRMCEFGFIEDTDFYSILSKTSENGRPSTDHQLTVEMAKEISMLQRNDKGKQARQYFIQLEKAWNTPEMIIAKALKLSENKVNALMLESKQKDQIIVEMQPKAIFADAVTASKTTILIGELAKLLKQNGIEIGQNRLFEWLRNKGYLISRKGTDYNMPTQKAMEQGLFEIKETSIAHSDGHTSINKTPKVTGKGQTYFVNLFLNKPKQTA